MEEQAKNAVRQWCTTAQHRARTRQNRKCESKAECRKKFYSNSQKKVKLKIYFYIVPRIGAAEIFRAFVAANRTSVAHTRHTHHYKLSSFIWFFRSTLVSLFELACIERNTILRISAFCYSSDEFFECFVEHKWTPHTQWALDLHPFCGWHWLLDQLKLKPLLYGN